MGLGCQPPSPLRVATVVRFSRPPTTVERTVRLPVPEMRLKKKRSDGRVESTHVHGLLAAPPDGSSTACEPTTPERTSLSSAPVTLALFCHDQPDAPASNPEPLKGR